MKRNSRLSLALHTLSHMAGEPGRVRTSSDIADHAGTNPVVVRRVLGKLREVGLLSSEKGHAGGWQLAKSADSITLADVYVALDERLVSGSGDIGEPTHCSVETDLQARVAEVLDDIEVTLVERLRETTITDLHPNDCGYCAS
ncbi:MAG: Rrf2 family transcriptional regulator [Tateyamaria sp.]